MTWRDFGRCASEGIEWSTASRRRAEPSTSFWWGHAGTSTRSFGIESSETSSPLRSRPFLSFSRLSPPSDPVNPPGTVLAPQADFELLGLERGPEHHVALFSADRDHHRVDEERPGRGGGAPRPQTLMALERHGVLPHVVLFIGVVRRAVVKKLGVRKTVRHPPEAIPT